MTATYAGEIVPSGDAARVRCADADWNSAMAFLAVHMGKKCEVTIKILPAKPLNKGRKK